MKYRYDGGLDNELAQLALHPWHAIVEPAGQFQIQKNYVLAGVHHSLHSFPAVFAVNILDRGIRAKLSQHFQDSVLAETVSRIGN